MPLTSMKYSTYFIKLANPLNQIKSNEGQQLMVGDVIEGCSSYSWGNIYPCCFQYRVIAYMLIRALCIKLLKGNIKYK